MFTQKSINDAFEKMRNVWTSQKAADRLITKVYDAPHEYNRGMQDDAFNWLDKIFNTGKRK